MMKNNILLAIESMIAGFRKKIIILYIDFGDLDDKKIHDYYIVCIFHDFSSFC